MTSTTPARRSRRAAGSVVTSDIPANVIAVGNPCRVLREIRERDRECYHADWKIPPELLEKSD